MVTFVFLLFFGFGTLFGMDNHENQDCFQVLNDIDFEKNIQFSGTSFEQKKALIDNLLQIFSQFTRNTYHINNEKMAKIRRITISESPEVIKIDIKTTDSIDN